MIYIVTHHDYAHTIKTVAEQVVSHGAADVRLLDYCSLFSSRRAPVGHYVFTDFDRLTAYEIQVAEGVARLIQQAAPNAKILNWPARVLERYPLLRQFARMGLNDFSAYRLDSGEMPATYPVFIRSEDDCQKPDTPLLYSENELIEAIGRLRNAGLPMKRRIAVELCAEPDENGIYRKYGVFKVGDHLVPHHLFHHNDWYVKRGTRKREDSAPYLDEVQHFIREIPHADAIRRAFDVADIDFGRIDYSIVNGRLQTYEINTNPTFPPLWAEQGKADLFADRRELFRSRMLAALSAIDTPIEGPRKIIFPLPEPRLQIFRPCKPSAKKDVAPAVNGPATEAVSAPQS